MAFDCRVRARYGCCMARLKRCFPRVLATINPMNASQENLWPAPFASKSLDATVVVPGSKSLSNRYLILAALGHRPVRLVGLLRSRDTELMMDALRSLGVRCEIDEQVDTTVTVMPFRRPVPRWYEGILRSCGNGDALRARSCHVRGRSCGF